MTIGYAATGYDVNMDYLQGQKMSCVAFDKVLAELAEQQASFDDVMDRIEEN